MKNNKLHKPKRGYWYEFYSKECVICGGGDDWKERIYDKPKPSEGNDHERYEHIQTACSYHFL